MNNLILPIEFKGPYSFTSTKNNFFFDNDLKCPGVYLWTVKSNAKYDYIYYIGMSSDSILGRHVTHLTNYLGGQYSIVDPVKIKDGVLERIYVPYNISNFIENHTNISKQLFDLLESIDVYFAEINNERRIIERIEGALIEAAKNMNGEILDVVKYSKRWQDEAIQKVALIVPHNLNLPEIIEY